MSDQIKTGILEAAAALGVNPVDLATVISYETAGTFDPTKRGPTTQHGQHRGLIQFGEPQAKRHGVDWDNPVTSQLGRNGAVVSYMQNAGVKPGMGLLDLYSAVNAGGVGLYNRSDASNGGAPGTVRDKVENQMHGHRRKAEALIGGASAKGALANSMMQQGVDPGLAHAAAARPAPSKAAGPLEVYAARRGASGGSHNGGSYDSPLMQAAMQAGEYGGTDPLSLIGLAGKVEEQTAPVVNTAQAFRVERGPDGLDRFILG